MRARLVVGWMAAVTGVIAAMIACGGAYSALDTPDASTSSPDDPEASSSDAFVARDDASPVADGSTPTKSHYCDQIEASIWCEDFDTVTNASQLSDGSFVQMRGGTFTLESTVGESAPNGLRVAIAAPEGGPNPYATVARTFPMPGDQRVTVKADIYFDSVPQGYATAALVFSSGQTTVTGNVLGNGSGGILIFWELSYGNTSLQKSTSIPLGSFHTLAISSNGISVSALVDDVSLGTIPLTGALSTATAQVGLYYGGPFAVQSTAFFDNVRVTAP